MSPGDFSNFNHTYYFPVDSASFAMPEPWYIDLESLDIGGIPDEAIPCFPNGSDDGHSSSSHDMPSDVAYMPDDDLHRPGDIDFIHDHLDLYSDIRQGDSELMQRQLCGILAGAAARPREVEYQPANFFLIPQELYGVDRTRNFLARPPLLFHMRGKRATSPGAGVSLVEAFKRDLRDLVDNKQPIILSESSSKVTCRVLPCGYPKFEKGISSRRSNARRDGLSLEAIARHVAGAVKDCMKRSGEVWMFPYASHGYVQIRFEDLVLLELRHVSKGTFQPVLAAVNFTVIKASDSDL